MIRLEQLRPDEGPRLRAVRLRALLDAPDAFGTTFEQASAWGADAWAQQLRDLVTFVAVEDGNDVGMVRCAHDAERADVAWLISMWVAPEVRRRGIGGALVDIVIGRTRAKGVSRLLLDVTDTNVPAIALYAAKGFAPNGNVSSLPPPRDHLREHQRELRLVEPST